MDGDAVERCHIRRPAIFPGCGRTRSRSSPRYVPAWRWRRTATRTILWQEQCRTFDSRFRTHRLSDHLIHNVRSIGARQVLNGEYLPGTSGQLCPDAFLSSTATIRIVALIETLSDLGQKQRVRIETEDGTTIEARINQIEYAPNENLRLELVSDGSDEYQRYQVRSHVEDGTWVPVDLRGYDREREDWMDLGTVADATPEEMYGSMKSDDMEAQEDTGTGG